MELLLFAEHSNKLCLIVQNIIIISIICYKNITLFTAFDFVLNHLYDLINIKPEPNLSKAQYLTIRLLSYNVE